MMFYANAWSREFVCKFNIYYNTLGYCDSVTKMQKREKEREFYVNEL